MRLRRLTPSGIDHFSTYLMQLKAQPNLPPPAFLLTETDSSQELATDAEISDELFPTRLDAARYLDQLLSSSGLTQIERDAGLWSWLTLFYFDQICPVAENNARHPGELARYIPAINVSRRYYRHMLLGPFVIYRLHSDDPARLLALLSSPVHIGTSETYRLFIENPTLLACRAVVATATCLYFDKQRGRLRRGAGAKEAGGCRRLVKFLQQLDCTFDLPMLTEQRLQQLLPQEFQRFLSAQLELAR